MRYQHLAHVWRRGVLISSCSPTSTAHGTACFINMRRDRGTDLERWVATDWTWGGGYPSRSGRKREISSQTEHLPLRVAGRNSYTNFPIGRFLGCRRYFLPRRLHLSASPSASLVVCPSNRATANYSKAGPNECLRRFNTHAITNCPANSSRSWPFKVENSGNKHDKIVPTAPITRSPNARRDAAIPASTYHRPFSGCHRTVEYRFVSSCRHGYR